MKTVYVKGQGKFKASLRRSLTFSKLKEGKHYIEGFYDKKEPALYWIANKLTLKDFKKAIGAKKIWKYRMRFFEDINDTIPKENNTVLSKKEYDILSKYSSVAQTGL